MKEIVTCASLSEVRANIDRIDDDIVDLIAERSAYVAQAVRFKRSLSDVPAPERVLQVVERIRQRAAVNDLDPDVAEQTFRAMIGAFIAWESRRHEGRS